MRWPAILAFAMLTCHAMAAGPPSACAPIHAGPPCTEGPNCLAVPIFDVGDYWHGLAGCLRGLRDLWSRSGPQAMVDLGPGSMPVSQVVRRQVIGELARPNVMMLDGSGRRVDIGAVVGPDGRWRRPPASMALTNDLGVPYNGMGQSDFAYFLAQFAVLSRRSDGDGAKDDATAYLALSQASIDVNLKGVEQGGLSTSSTCAAGLACTWYHSVTRRDRRPAAGATLNQHLHVTRDLALLAVLADKEGLPGADRYRAASQAGLAQIMLAPGLRHGGVAPGLADFMPPGRPGQLAYYGIGVPEGKGYFLGSSGRDCNYHLHALDLIASILELNAAHVDRTEALRRAVDSCEGPLAQMFGAMRSRFERRVDAAVNDQTDGRDASCPALRQRRSLDERLLNRLAACRP